MKILQIHLRQVSLNRTSATVAACLFAWLLFPTSSCVGEEVTAVVVQGSHAKVVLAKGALASRTISVEHAEWLSRNTSLEGLQVTNVILDPGVVAKLVLLPQLKRLDLSNTTLCDADMSLLARCEQLEELDISNTAVSDLGIRELRKNTRLRDVLAFGLPLCSEGVLSHLSADGSLRVHNEAGVVRSLVKTSPKEQGALPEWEPVSQEFVIFPGKARCHGAVKGGVLVHDSFDELLAKGPSTSEVSINGVAFVDEDFKVMLKMPNLSSIQLASCNAGDNLCGILAESTSLKSVRLIDTFVTIAGIRSLAKSNTISQVEILDSRRLVDALSLAEVRRAHPGISIILHQDVPQAKTDKPGT